MNYIKHSLTILLLMMSLCIESTAETSDCIGYLPIHSDFELILAPNKLPQNSKLKIIPSGDVIAFFDGICYNLCDSTSATIVFPEESKPHDIFWDNDGNCFLSDGHALYLFGLQTGQRLRLIDSANATTNFIVGNSEILYYKDQDKDLYMYDLGNYQSSLLWHFDEKIQTVKKAEGGYFIGFGNRIAIITDDQQYIPITETSKLINAITPTTDGAVFYGTDDELGYYDSNHNRLTIVHKGVTDLLCTNNSLYVIFNDKSIARINNISEFRLLSIAISEYSKDAHISANLSFNSDFLQDSLVLVAPDELNISPEQLCLIPNHGIFLLTGDELISLDGDDEIPQVHIPSDIHPECIIFTEDDVLACNDTTIVSCKSTPQVVFAFDTNQFQIWPTTDNNIYVTTRINDTTAIFFCNPRDRTIKPFIKLNEEVILIAGDTTQCLIATRNSIYLMQNKETTLMLKHFEPITSATLSKCGVVFSSDNKLFLLEGANRATLIGKGNCKKLLSDSEILYVYSDDGSLVSYRIRQKNNDKF